MNSSWSIGCELLPARRRKGPGACPNLMLVLVDLQYLALILGMAPGALLLEFRCLAGLVGRRLLVAPIRYFRLPSISGPWFPVRLLVPAQNKCFWSVGCQKWRPLSELVGFGPGILGLVGLG